eukprot:CAMPEP_0114471830 /NCGR_PEP_ID=MMETSP0104-20121206/12049_1 /TAXON_ID=37642 ORGANISM="Paraphysomonas imperforata, Strain PA2" /NCGR_SAMPLE_ID=MMETSP0104 /ASSEMBLY_ACC=CAM_ASM_000202 /LENGTH=343 /DNA_ID=CAMNT_0001645757 /DNA_START=147 /DNA_END=1178 /DNA_ORIENTATION=-
MSNNGDLLAKGFYSVVLHVNLLMTIPRNKVRARRIVEELLPWLRNCEDDETFCEVAHVWFLLGHWESIREPKDAAKVASYYQLAADSGHFLAQTSLASMYRSGEGVMQNLPLAHQLYDSAAQQGYAVAQCTLGCMYEVGEGCERNRDRKKQCMELAAAQEYPGGLFCLGVYNKDAQYWSRGAEIGDRKCIRKIAYCYLNGEHGRRRDRYEAYRFLHAAADLGEEESMMDIARFFRWGIGVDVSMIEAVRYSRRLIRMKSVRYSQKAEEMIEVCKKTQKYASEVWAARKGFLMFLAQYQFLPHRVVGQGSNHVTPLSEPHATGKNALHSCFAYQQLLIAIFAFL